MIQSLTAICFPTGHPKNSYQGTVQTVTYLCKCRVMYNGMRKAFPGLRIVSEEHEEYDGPVTVPRLHEDALREDVSLKSQPI